MKGVVSRIRPSLGSVRPIIVGSLLAIFFLTVCFWRLGTITSGLGPQEYMARQNAQSVHQILDYGINAPYFLPLHLALKSHINQIFYLRLVSVLFGILVFFCLYKLLVLGFGRTIAIFTALIFATTPWLLLSARSAEPAIMWQWLVVVVAFFVWALRQKKNPGMVWVLLCFVAAISLYVPGLIWLLLFGAIIGRRRFTAAVKQTDRAYLAAGLIFFVAILTPLVLALIAHPTNIKQLLLLPNSFPPFVELLKSIIWSLTGILWRTQSHIDIGIGRLPLLNILGIALSVFGAYALFSRTRRLSYFLGIIIAFSVLAAGINQNPQLLLLGLPAIFVFIAAGLRYLYLEWRRVFPLNPFARALAITLLIFVVSMQIFYGLRYALVAWPDTEATKTVYVLK